MGSLNVRRKLRSVALQAVPPEVPDTGRPVNESTPLEGMSTFCHVGNAEPEGSNTDKRAALHFLSTDPSPATRRSTHSWIPVVAAHAIRGTDTFEGNDTDGDVDVHPTVPVSRSQTRICLSLALVQKHFGFTGSIRTV